MKFLADQNVRFRAILALRKAGYDIMHTSEIGLATTEDPFIIDKSVTTERILSVWSKTRKCAIKNHLSEGVPAELRWDPPSARRPSGK